VATVHDIMWLVNPRFNSRSRLVRAVAGPFYRAAIDACMSSATRVLAVSEATRRAMAEHAPWHATKIRVTPNGIDRDKIRPLADGEAARAIAHLVSPRTLLVLTVGDASPHKNHANAVRGYMRAFGARADWRMVLVRRFLRLDPEMHALLREPAVAERVIALPHVPAATLNALYHAARIYLHPSYYEGFGIPLLEAMAARIPVVTSSVSSLPEVAGDAALLVDPADPEAIATALLRLDADEALRARLIAAGERRLELFTWERCAKRTLEAYREALGAGSC
jgi:glycosyltransferase involved in cell wall biosynthesis